MDDVVASKITIPERPQLILQYSEHNYSAFIHSSSTDRQPALDEDTDLLDAISRDKSVLWVQPTLRHGGDIRLIVTGGCDGHCPYSSYGLTQPRHTWIYRFCTLAGV